MTSLWHREVSLYAMPSTVGATIEPVLREATMDMGSNAVAFEDAFGLHIVA